jgi:hypothetical protein
VIRSAEEFVRLRSSGREADRQRARREELSEAVSRDVLERFPDMRFWLARNETVPLAILRDLAADDDPKVRRIVAQSRGLDDQLIEQLSRDASNGVRLVITTHPTCPVNVLQRMAADDPWEGVRKLASRRLTAMEAG